MKHKLSITLLLLGMFLITQLIGIFIISSYDPSGGDLPFGLENPDKDSKPNFISIIFSFAIAFGIIFLLTKYRWKFVIKAWFFFVIALSLGIATNAILKNYTANSQIISLAIAITLALLKIFRPGVFIHNLTELFIYPGIATIFIPILTPISIILLLLTISFYDMWAVWKSGVMQKMAKFQMEELRIFGGFLIPSVPKKVKLELKNIKQKYKDKKIPKKVAEKKFKVNLAILGGGDVIFPIITTGIFMRYFGLTPALFILAGSFISLAYLFFKTEKGKSYPAMPYISIGILAGLAVWKLFFF